MVSVPEGHGEGVGRGREGGEAMSRSNVSGAQEHDTTIKVLELMHGLFWRVNTKFHLF